MSNAPVLSPAAVTLSSHVQNWLGRHGFPVMPYSSSEGTQTVGVASSTPGQVNWTPQAAASFERLAARLGTRGRLTQGQIEAARVALHEGIHQMRYGRTPGVNSGDSATPGTGAYYEEGSTEAVARDLLPIFTAQMFGSRIPSAYDVYGAYGPQVDDVRQLSTFGSGAKRFTDYKARVWRRTFNHADADARQAMVAQAHQAQESRNKAAEAVRRVAGRP